jgi:FAD dependent oxidoreductase TIGR03364
MKHSRYADVAVIGAGIVGLAHAYTLAKQGLKVVLFERTERAVGASIRNFGLVWPIGQPSGALMERALRARAVWQTLAKEAGFWCAEVGSLHLAYHDDEAAVIHEYLQTSAPEACRWLDAEAVLAKSHAVNPDGLKGALWSSSEMNVDPRQAIRALPTYLEREHGVELRFGALVTGIAMPHVETASERWHVERVFVCSGNDFETLYPQAFAESGITRCKLQMMRTAPQPDGWQLGACLCAGLTLLHYGAFAHCESLAALRQRVQAELPFYVQEGIHVLVSQTALGEITLGDHHEYGLTHEPFDRAEVDEAILRYLSTFARLPSLHIAERWHGIYPKMTDGSTEFITTPEANVTVVNGLGGAGMTLSFGLAQEVCAG